jgi:hypothetical protein
MFDPAPVRPILVVRVREEMERATSGAKPKSANCGFRKRCGAGCNSMPTATPKSPALPPQNKTAACANMAAAIILQMLEVSPK